jgi:hypothetical protein
MKRVHLTTILLILTLCSAASAQDETRHCSNTSAAGKWGFTTSGVLILPTGAVPVTAAGHFSEDLKGNISGSQARSLGGNFGNETFTGTATVNADCTAHYTLNVYDDLGNLVRTSVLDGVLTRNSKKAHVIFESITLPDGASLPSVLSVDGDKI